MLKVFISSIAFEKYTIEKIIKIAESNNFNVEFSSGIAYEENLESIYINTSISRMPHNYFPAPKIPFVINLGSINEQIRQASINHCINGLRLAHKSNSDFFSAHAGFCVDPEPIELGKKIDIKDVFNKYENRSNFLKSIRSILVVAKKLKIKFLIENNVIAKFNLINNINPFLCCESSEINWIFNEINDKNLGLLLDTAHLKVSCKTLKLNLEEEYSNIKQHINCIHHSDNDGFIDNNSILDENYWFLKHMYEFKKIPHVIEVKRIDTKTILQQIKILKSV